MSTQSTVRTDRHAQHTRTRLQLTHHLYLCRAASRSSSASAAVHAIATAVILLSCTKNGCVESRETRKELIKKAAKLENRQTVQYQCVKAVLHNAFGIIIIIIIAQSVFRLPQKRNADGEDDHCNNKSGKVTRVFN